MRLDGILIFSLGEEAREPDLLDPILAFDHLCVCVRYVYTTGNVWIYSIRDTRLYLLFATSLPLCHQFNH